MATRALQKVLRYRTPNTPTPDFFQPSGDVWVWDASSKNNEKDEWIRAQVVQTHRYFLEVRRYKDGSLCRDPTMKPAYEDVRIAPKGELTKELLSCTLEHELGYSFPDRGETVETETRSTDTTIMTHPDKTLPSLLARTAEGVTRIETAQRGPSDDIGSYGQRMSERNPIQNRAELTSDKSRILREIYTEVGSKQVTRNKLGFAPPWILEQAFEKEYQSNWAGAFEKTHEADIPRDANIIASHVVYKIKTAEDVEQDLKLRIVPHGNGMMKKTAFARTLPPHNLELSDSYFRMSHSSACASRLQISREHTCRAVPSQGTYTSDRPSNGTTYLGSYVVCYGGLRSCHTGSLRREGNGKRLWRIRCYRIAVSGECLA